MSDVTRSTSPRKPKACEDCGARNPYLTFEPGWEDDDDGRWVCEHRRACEGRQMLAAGAPVADAARHAQGLDENVGD